MSSGQKSTGETLTLAVPQGAAVARAVTTEVIDVLSQAVRAVSGGAFRLTATGAVPGEGVLTKETAINSLAAMLAANDKSGVMKSATTWAIGDLANVITDNFEDGESLIENLVSVHGLAKHTIDQAKRVCRFFAIRQRDEALTFSHYQELFNYFTKDGKFRDGMEAVCMGLIDEIKLGEIESPDIEMSTGKTIPATRRTLSVKATRELAREAAGFPPRSQSTETSPATPGFIYFDVRTGDAYRSAMLSKEACATMLAIDLKSMAVLDTDGEDLHPLPELGHTSDLSYALDEPRRP